MGIERSHNSEIISLLGENLKNNIWVQKKTKYGESNPMKN
jgi:hypothetical protein